MLRHLGTAVSRRAVPKALGPRALQLPRAGLTFSRPGGMNVTTYANRDQIPTTPPSCGLGARDRWLAGVLAGWLGQMADVLHRDTPASKDWALETCCLGCQSRRFAGQVTMPIGG